MGRSSISLFFFVGLMMFMSNLLGMAFKLISYEFKYNTFLLQVFDS